MGYQTEFTGRFGLDRKLTPEHQKYLVQFSETRRMKREASVAAQLSDPIREAAKLPIGIEAEFFVGGTGDYGQGHDASVLNHNNEPETQPGLWCQWQPSDDGMFIQWNGAEKFYDYIAWLNYIIVNFLERWGYTITGIVDWQGEEPNDKGRIIAKDNKLEVVKLP